MSRFTLRLAVFYLFSTFSWLQSPVVRADQPPVKDWRRIDFVGNHTFSSEQLTSALTSEPDFLFACHPHSDEQGLEKLVTRLLETGYRRLGFANIEVRRRDRPIGSDRDVYEISEGPRFYAGKIVVQAKEAFESDRLIELLTNKQPPAAAFPAFVVVNGKQTIQWKNSDGANQELEAAVWQPGEPVPFGAETQLRRKVSSLLSAMGYSSAITFVRLERNEDEQTADLIVEMVSLGELDRADEIVIDGLKFNSTEQVQTLLGLNTGDVINRNTIQGITKRLWESARFTKHEVSFDAKSQRLNVELEEFPGLPTLDQKISPEGEVFLKARRWLDQIDRRNEDFVADVQYENWRVQFAHANNGMLLVLQDAANAKAVTLIADDERLLLDQSLHPDKFEIPIQGTEGSVRFSFQFGASSDPEHLFATFFGFSFSSDRPTNQFAQHTIDTKPVDWLALAYKEIFETKILDSKLVGSGKSAQVVIDVESGAIEKFSFEGGSICFERGAFRRIRDECLARCAAKRNHFVADASVSSFVEYLVHPVNFELMQDALVAWSGSPRSFDPHLQSALAKLIDGGLLTPFDLMVNKMFEGREQDRFTVPAEQRPEGKSPFDQIKYYCAKLMLQNATSFFDLQNDDWPLQVVREASLMLIGKTEHTGKVLSEIVLNPENGPLCHGFVAVCLRALNLPHAAAFATRALETLDAQHFAADYEKLTSGGAHKSITEAMRAIQSLDESEIDALCELVRNESLNTFLQIIHENPIRDQVDEAGFWYIVSRPHLQQSLEKLRR